MFLCTNRSWVMSHCVKSNWHQQLLRRLWTTLAKQPDSCVCLLLTLDKAKCFEGRNRPKQSTRTRRSRSRRRPERKIVQNNVMIAVFSLCSVCKAVGFTSKAVRILLFQLPLNIKTAKVLLFQLPPHKAILVCHVEVYCSDKHCKLFSLSMSVAMAINTEHVHCHGNSH